MYSTVVVLHYGIVQYGTVCTIKYIRLCPQYAASAATIPGTDGPSCTYSTNPLSRNPVHVHATWLSRGPGSRPLTRYSPVQINYHVRTVRCQKVERCFYCVDVRYSSSTVSGMPDAQHRTLSASERQPEPHLQGLPTWESLAAAQTCCELPLNCDPYHYQYPLACAGSGR